MADGSFASVSSLDAIAQFRVAVLTFAGETQAAISEVDADLVRMQQWLKMDRLPHWTKQIKVRSDGVQQAKADLARKRLQTMPDPASCIDERKALQRAEEKLAEAHAKLKATKRWITLWEEQLPQFRAALVPVRDLADRDLLATATRLGKQIQYLEQYLQAAPEGGQPTGQGGRGLRAGMTDGSGSGEKSAYAMLRRLAVPAVARGGIDMLGEAALTTGEGPPIDISDLEQLERLALEGRAAASGDRVLLEPGALSGPVICMIRTPPDDTLESGDSGWYIAGPAAAGMKPQPTVGVTIQTVLDRRPDLTVPLLLPPGVMLVASAGRIVSLALGNDEELWRS